MQRVILDTTATQRVLLPHNSRILALSVERGDPTLWYMTDGRDPTIELTFHVLFENEPFLMAKQTILLYHGSVQLPHSNRQMHLFSSSPLLPNPTEKPLEVLAPYAALRLSLSTSFVQPLQPEQVS